MELILSELFSSNTAKMTSLDIAELVGSRHDKVKQSIERLVARDVIAHPPMGVMQTTSNNRVYETDVYIFSGEEAKVHSLVVVAQLSPEFTSDIIHRWLFLEKQNQTLTKKLEHWQTKELNDSQIGSFHGRGLAERKKTKHLNNGMIETISNEMQPTLGL